MKNRKRTTSSKKQTDLGTAQALKKTPNGKYNQHNRDINSKNIFDNRVLCAHIPKDKINRILKNSPEHVVDVMVSVMESLCFKIDVSAEERMECVQKVRERKMGYLWENMEKFSIQEERRKTGEQRTRR